MEEAKNQPTMIDEILDRLIADLLREVGLETGGQDDKTDK